MKRVAWGFAVVAFALQARADSSTPVTRKVVLAPLSDAKTGDGGCGCLLSVNAAGGKRPLLFVEPSGATARVNLGGRDVDATPVGPEPVTDGKRGSRYVETWRAGTVSIRVAYRVTATCGHGLPSEDEGCEGVEVSATVTASDGRSKASVQATGYCGC